MGVLDDVGEHRLGFFLGVASNDESVDADAHRVAVLCGLGLDVVDLRLQAFGRVAIGEVPVRHAGRVVARSTRAAALEDFGVRLLHRLRAQRVVAEAIEVALEGEVVLRPDTLERADEFVGTAVALVVLQPWLADGLEFALEPAAHHVDGDTAVRDVVDGGDLLGHHGRVPRAGQDRGQHLELGGRMQQRLAERHRLVLVLRAVARGEADLAQRIFEAGRLGRERQALVVFKAPVGALLDGADHEAAADVGYPVGELDGGGGGRRLAHGKALSL
ncbi:hypothetical protein D9M68_712900 [compost metagenome]